MENRPGTRHRLPENVQSWTYEAGSLTRRLRCCYHDRVTVKVLWQQWRMPFLSERKRLKHAEHHYAFIREVLLHNDGKPLILARTVIPAGTIKVARSNLAHLGTRPLGEVIFASPRLERLEMDVALLKPSLWTPVALVEAGIKQPIWGRRTVYAIHDRQMLVSEFFLPEVLANCC